MKYYFAGFTDKGQVRAINQDAILMKCTKDIALFCVADGMGGHSQGERASAEVINALSRWWDNLRLEDYYYNFNLLIEAVKKTLQEANTAIRRETPAGELCGSTAVVLLMFKNRCGIVSAGDSRIYRRKNQLNFIQVTEDEVWENVYAKDLTPEEIRNHPNRGKLVNAVGVSEEMKVRASATDLKHKDMFLLCSDGVYKYLKMNELKKDLLFSNRNNLENKCMKVKDNIFKNGARDNLSLILVITENESESE